MGIEQAIANNVGMLIPILAIVLGCSIGAISIIGCTIKSVSKSNQIEKSRRDIAAYIAEGSMSPEEGERLMKAGKHHNA